jgi:hypothetical protein
MKKVIRLTESQLKEVINKIINEVKGEDLKEGDPIKIPGQGYISGSSHKAVQSKFAGCRSVKPGGQGLQYVAKMIYDSVTGLGTNENKIYQALGMLKSYNSLCSLLSVYKQTYGTDLFTDLDGDIDDENVWMRISQIITPLKVMTQTTGGAKTAQTTGGAKPAPTAPVAKPAPTAPVAKPAPIVK